MTNFQKKHNFLDDLVFNNRYIRNLPADPETDNYPRQVQSAFYSYVKPRSVRAPELVAYSREVADFLDLSEQACQSEDFVQVFSGNKVLSAMEPYATCYGGHQFGQWAGQLGDGRAINLGEVVNQQGQHWTLQLKGAGLTPYSRNADGLAVLRSSVREFLCSEAMHHLGVPTTRALSLISTGETVMRDMFYNGNPRPEPGAVVCRVAPSFIRFGNFQIFTARQELEHLKQLVDYCISTDFPHLGQPNKDTYLQWFKEICQLTIDMIVHWQRVGFVHGVMNTDNLSILGLTIDYGPYGWLEGYDPNWTPNTTDRDFKRYSFGKQPEIAMWNLTQLANAIYPLIEQVEPFQEILQHSYAAFNEQWLQMMGNKLGLLQCSTEDEVLISKLLEVLKLHETDMTLLFRNLAQISTERDSLNISDTDLLKPIMSAYYLPEQLTDNVTQQMADWLRGYIKRLQAENVPDSIRRQNMNGINPKYVLRNYLAQQAIDQAEQGDNTLVNELLELLRHPYDEQPENEKYAAKRPEWARNKAGCSMLSCSS